MYLLCTYIEYTTQDTIYNPMFQCQILCLFYIAPGLLYILIYVNAIKTNLFMKAH